MEQSVFSYVRKHGQRQVLIILAILMPMFALQYLKFQMPKTIVDDALGNAIDTATGDELPERIVFAFDGFWGLPGFDGVYLGAYSYLFVLCGIFLLLVILVGGFKFVVNTLKGILSERLLRRLRFELLSRVMRFPLPQFRKTSQGEIVTMVTAEVEPLGGFFGDAYIQPIFQGGIFITTLAFLFVQDFRLGLAAFAAVPVQAWLIPKLQTKIRLLGKERVKNVRALSDRIGETVTGMGDLHANDGIAYSKADMSRRLGKIFDIRYEIYRRKFFMKFINNFINDLTPFFFFAIGGYYVLAGDLSLGVLVAGLTAYKELASPWKELLAWYQMQADSAVKYDSLVEQFQPSGMFDENRQQNRPDPLASLKNKEIAVSGLVITDDDGLKTIDNASVTLKPGEAVLLTGPSGGGKTELAQVLAGILAPDSGKLMIGDVDMGDAHMALAGSRIGYAGPESVVFAGKIRDNIHLSLKHYPNPEEVPDGFDEFVAEAEASGNSTDILQGDWLNLSEAGLDSHHHMTNRTMKLFGMLGLENTLYEAGMQMVINDKRRPGLVEGLVKARKMVAERLKDMDADDLIRRFQEDSYNDYASVGENVVYGKPVDDTFSFDRLGENDYVRQLLAEHGLKKDFLDIGIKLAHLMVDLFKDVPAGHPFYEQYSFVDADSLPVFSSIVRRHDTGGDEALTQEDKNLLRSLPFHLTPQRHRLGLIDEDMQQRLLDLRHAFRDKMPDDLKSKVIFFDEHGYNPGLTIRGNILFGRIAHGRSRADEIVGSVVSSVLDELRLRIPVVLSSMDFDVGNGGAKLPLARRQLIVLVRALMKNPDILIINEALSAIDAEERKRIATELIKMYDDKILIWVDNAEPEGVPFNHCLEMSGGRLREMGDHSAGADVAETDISESSGSNITSEMDSLRAIPLFAGIDRSRLKFLAFASEVVQFMPGETVFHQGDAGDSAYVILRGSGEVWLEQDEKRSKKLNDVGKNSLVGEMALLSDAPRSAAFITEEGMECLKITREVFLELVYQDASISAQITRLMSNRLLATLQLMN